MVNVSGTTFEKLRNKYFSSVGRLKDIVSSSRTSYHIGYHIGVHKVGFLKVIDGGFSGWSDKNFLKDTDFSAGGKNLYILFKVFITEPENSGTIIDNNHAATAGWTVTFALVNRIHIHIGDGKRNDMGIILLLTL